MTHKNIKAPSELARIGGQFHITIHRADGTEESQYCDNLIPDIGIKHLGDILAGVESTNIDLGFIEPGEGTTPVAIGDTDIEDSLDPQQRNAFTTQTRSATTPFEVVISVFINSTTYTRPQTITELAVFFTPDVTGDLFARGILDTPITFNTNDTATLSYGIIFR